jgi:hypothetical protein
MLTACLSVAEFAGTAAELALLSMWLLMAGRNELRINAVYAKLAAMLVVREIVVYAFRFSVASRWIV